MCVYTYMYHIHIPHPSTSYLETEDWTRLKDAPGKVKADRAAALAAVRQSPEAPIRKISDLGFSTDVIDVIRNNHLVEIIL